MSAIVRWEDPPDPTRNRSRTGRYDWYRIGAALKRRPRKWALVAVTTNATTANTMALGIRRGNYGGIFFHGQFEAAGRTIDGEARVYARWVGEPS